MDIEINTISSNKKSKKIFFIFILLLILCVPGATHAAIGDMTTYTGTGDSPLGIAFDGTNMWTANYWNDSVTKISPTGVMTTYPGTGDHPRNIAFDGTNMWTANMYDDTVTKISPTGVMTTYPGTGDGPLNIGFDGTNMWTTNNAGDSVTKISPTGVMTTYPVSSPNGIAFDGTNMWVTNYPGNSVTKISPTGVTTTYPGTGLNPFAMAFDGTNMWVANGGGDSVTKVSPTGVMTTYLGTGSGPTSIAFDGTNMWVANSTSPDDSVTKISPTGVMTTYPGTGPYAWGIAFDGTNMWTANYSGDSVTKICAVGACAANLVSENLALSAGPYTQGVALTVSARVRNSGTDGTGIGFSDDFTYQWNGTGGTWNNFAGNTVAKGALAAGDQSNDGPVPFIPGQVGTLYIQHCVDSTNVINEGANETPNCTVSGGVAVNAAALPDLSAANTGPAAGTNFLTTDSITFTGTANNSNLAAVPEGGWADVEIDWYSDGGFDNFNAFGGVKLGAFVLNETKNLTYTWNNPPAGSHRYRFNIDTDGTGVVESNETNNRSVWVAFTVSPAVLPGIPTALISIPEANCGTGLITLRWNAAAGATDYDLRDGGDIIYTGPLLTYNHTGLVNSSAHSYTVRSKNSFGDSLYTSPAENALAPAACPSGDIAADSCTVNVGSSTCSTNVAWSSADFVGVPEITQGAAVLSINPSGGLVREVSYTDNIFTLRDQGGTFVDSTSVTMLCAPNSVVVNGVCVSLPIITVTTNSSVIRSGKSATIEAEVDSAFDLVCTISDGGSPRIIGHTGSPSPQTSSTSTRPLTSAQMVNVECGSLLYPALRSSNEVRVRVVPTYQEI